MNLMKRNATILIYFIHFIFSMRWIKLLQKIRKTWEAICPFFMSFNTTRNVQKWSKKSSYQNNDKIFFIGAMTFPTCCIILARQMLLLVYDTTQIAFLGYLWMAFGFINNFFLKKFYCPYPLLYSCSVVWTWVHIEEICQVLDDLWQTVVHVHMKRNMISGDFQNANRPTQNVLPGVDMK